MNRKIGRPLENNLKVKIVETGEIFDNYILAADAIHGNRSCVYLCLTGSRKKHRGYTFEYVEK